MMATLAWVWEELSWKYTGGSRGVSLIALVVFAAFALGACWFTGARSDRWRTALLLGAPLLLATCGATCTSMSDFNPGGGVNFMFANNTPDNATPGFAAFMLGAAVIGGSALWPLSVARRDAPSRTLITTGGWLLVAALVTWALGKVARVELGRHLLPLLALACSLLFAGRSVDVWLSGLGLGVGLLAALGFALQPADVAICAGQGLGLVRSARSTPVEDLRVPGYQLRRVDCRTTLQFIDDPIEVVVGVGPGGELMGAELFAHATGTASERARAAQDILLPGACDAVLAEPPPVDEGAELVFSCSVIEYLYGRGTTLGSTQEVRRYGVDRQGRVTQR
jgi:hypothetical protein